MSERLLAAAKINARLAPNEDQIVPQVVLAREGVALLCWGTTHYRCGLCRFEWEVWMGMGVEGPPSLREAGLFVPSPFMLSSCPAWPVNPDATDAERGRFIHLESCKGTMTHYRGDRTFPPALAPDDVPRFVLDPWHDCALLVTPDPALSRARAHFTKEGV